MSKSVIVLAVLYFITISFAQAENWLYKYNGTGNGDDEALFLVYGTDNNIYAAGRSYGSGTGNDFTVISLTTTGDTNWTYRYNGPANDADAALALDFGADGNIYAAGSSQGDFIVISLSTAGDTNWTYRYDGSANDYDAAFSIIYGADGNIYAAGYSYNIGTMEDFTVLSFTTAGDTNWVYRYDGPGNGGDAARSIVFGADGNIYAAGYSSGITSTSDLTVVSLSTAGDTNWTYKYDGPGNLMDRAWSIDYGADGNVYAAGSSQGNGSNADFIVISLSTVGDTNWVYRYNGSGNEIDNASSVTFGADGNIYAAGKSTEIGTYGDFIVISISTAGDTNWVHRYNGPANSYDEARSLIYGADGNIYAAGRSYGSGTDNDFTVISLTTTGDTNWTYRYNGPASDADEAFSLVYGADDNIYACGYSTSSITLVDFTVISLPSDLGIDERIMTAKKSRFSATILSGLLVLPKDKNCRVFDITGRVVVPDNIKPGIYFIEVDGEIIQKVVKVR